MGKEYQEDDVSTSCISSEPTMRGEVSSSTLGPVQPEKSDEKLQLDEIEAHKRSLKASLVKVSAMLVFMISSFVVIFAPGSPEALLHSASVVEITAMLNDMRMRVRIPGIVYTALQTVDKIHYALGSAAVLVIATVVYFSSRKKQNKGTICSAEANAIEEVRAEMQCENDNVVVKSPVCLCSSPPETTPQQWKPNSGLEIKLELEYSAGKMSSSEKMSPTETTQVFEKKPRRKSICTIPHNVVARDSSVGSCSSYDRSRSRECKAEAPLRRSSRIRNKVMSPPSAGVVQISSRG